MMICVMILFYAVVIVISIIIVVCEQSPEGTKIVFE